MASSQDLTVFTSQFQPRGQGCILSEIDAGSFQFQTPACPDLEFIFAPDLAQLATNTKPH